MSADRIAELHEQASEHYLNGNYAGALQAWRDILALDPNNGPALDGAQLAAQFVENPDAVTGGDGSAEIESALDLKLASKESPGTLVLDPHEDETPGDRKPVPQHGTDAPAPAVPADDEVPEGWEPTAAAADEPSYGLDVALPSARVPDNPALQELHRRVEDLLAQARVKAESGEREEALAILNRIAILDEDNAQAVALRTSLEASAGSDLEKIERGIVEGVAALEADNLGDAEVHFESVLALSPDHREAIHYLEVIRARRAAAVPDSAPVHTGHDELLGVGDLLGDLPAADPSAPTRAPHSDVVPAIPSAPKPAPERAAADRPATAAPKPFSTQTPGRALPISRLSLTLIGAGVIVLGGAWAWVHLGTAARPRPPAVVPPMHRANVKPPPKAPPQTTAPVPASPEDRAKAVVAAVAKGHAEMEAGDFSGAVLAFNAALSLDPSNAEARTGLHDAGEKYRAQQAEKTALDGIRLAFRDGEYTSGLRMAYRLPPTVPAQHVEAIKVAGWYDLAIVALRAGDCKEASGHLDELLALSPHDEDAQRLKEFAKLYAEAPKDRKFLDMVEALKFRDPPQ